MDTDVNADHPAIPLPVEIGPHNYMSLLLEPFENFIFDLDGTLWKDDGYTPIADIKTTYELLQEMGKNVFFITNGAHLTRAQLADKIRKVNGIKNVNEVCVCVCVCMCVCVRV